MNASHAAVTEWGLGHIPIEKDFTFLDVGCGGGRTIDWLASRARSVYGVDYSEASVAMAREINARAIAEGRVDIRQGSVSHLPFPNATFDVAIAVETHYYWPNDDTRSARGVPHTRPTSAVTRRRRLRGRPSVRREVAGLDLRDRHPRLTRQQQPTTP
jgi:SAM-dependent methyltransferase